MILLSLGVQFEVFEHFDFVGEDNSVLAFMHPWSLSTIVDLFYGKIYQWLFEWHIFDLWYSNFREWDQESKFEFSDILLIERITDHGTSIE